MAAGKPEPARGATPVIEHTSGRTTLNDPEARIPRQEDVDLLWSAASPYPDLQRVATAAQAADVPYVLETAVSHRVASLVLRALRAAGVEVDPRSTWAVSQVSAWEAHAALALPVATRTALAPLKEEGLAPLLLKGLALVHRYPSPLARPMDDIDLLLPPRLTQWAAAVLKRGGWVPGKHTGTDPRYDLVFRHPSAPGVPLELHFEFIEWRERPPSLEGEQLWAARVPTEVFGEPAYVLPPELELMTLIIHAAKGFHLFDRLLWAADLVVASAATPLNWDEVTRLATLTRRRVATAVALRLAERLGANVPRELLEITPVLARARAVGALLDPARPFMPRTRPWWVSYALVDTVGAKSKLAFGELVRPSRNKRRSDVVGDLARLVLEGGPALARARFWPDREKP